MHLAADHQPRAPHGECVVRAQRSVPRLAFEHVVGLQQPVVAQLRVAPDADRGSYQLFFQFRRRDHVGGGGSWGSGPGRTLAVVQVQKREQGKSKRRDGSGACRSGKGSVLRRRKSIVKARLDRFLGQLQVCVKLASDRTGDHQCLQAAPTNSTRREGKHRPPRSGRVLMSQDPAMAKPWPDRPRSRQRRAARSGRNTKPTPIDAMAIGFARSAMHSTAPPTVTKSEIGAQPVQGRIGPGALRLQGGV